VKRPPDRGFLLVFEGIDGVGKSTQIQAVAARLRELGHGVVTSKEPTDGPHGRRLRASATTGRLEPQAELELFILDRREHVADLILPALRRGEIVILDRYYFSTAAYQGVRGLDWEEILRRNEEFAPEPDLLVWLDLPPGQSLERIGRRGDVANEFERAQLLEASREIFSRIHRPYLRRLDATRPVEEIREEVVTTVLETVRQRRAD
jgi:dTMP kinase